MGKLVDSVLRMGRDGVDLGPCQEIRRSLPLYPSLPPYSSHQPQVAGRRGPPRWLQTFSFSTQCSPKEKEFPPSSHRQPWGMVRGGPSDVLEFWVNYFQSTLFLSKITSLYRKLFSVCSQQNAISMRTGTMTMPFPFEYPEGLQTLLCWAHGAEGGFTKLEQHPRLPHQGSLPSSCAFSIPACWNPGSQAVGKLYKGKADNFCPEKTGCIPGPGPLPLWPRSRSAHIPELQFP